MRVARHIDGGECEVDVLIGGNAAFVVENIEDIGAQAAKHIFFGGGIVGGVERVFVVFDSL